MLAKNIDLRNKTVLVTGAAGFIGANLVLELFKQVEGIKIIGLDSMNEYYDVRLKEYRLRQIEESGGKTSAGSTFEDKIQTDSAGWAEAKQDSLKSCAAAVRKASAAGTSGGEIGRKEQGNH